MSLLREVSLLSALSDADLEVIAKNAVVRHVAAGEYLFRQGDDADSLAIVSSGRLEVVLESHGGERVATAFSRRAVVGELALLSETTRSASVRAVRDSEVVQIPRAEFQRLVRSDGRLALGLARVLAGRLRQSIDVEIPRADCMVLGVVALTTTVEHDAVLAELRTALSQVARVALVDRRVTGDPATLAASLDECERTHDYVIFAATADAPDEWRRFCLRSADRVALLANSRAPAVPAPELFGRDVIVVGAPRVAAVVDGFRPRRVHTVRVGASFASDVQRAARRLTGRAIGLVLSGGGARGLAHLGVIERLLERGVTIDRVGGSSIGAFVAAMTGGCLEGDEQLRICRRELVEQRPFNDYTVPRVALLRARKARAMLTRVFGETRLERLPVPTFAVSADLTTGELVVHREGLVREAVGASMSIPGLVPPVLSEGRLLVDGGLLDNLPIDVMHADGEGPIVAVDVMRRPGPSRRGGLPGAPSIVETLARATFLASRQRAIANRAFADIVLVPDVDEIGLLQFNRIDDAVAAGRRAVDRAIADGLLECLRERRC